MKSKAEGSDPPATGSPYTPLQYGFKGNFPMQYTDAERRKLMNRLSRIRGQVEAMQGALAEDEECAPLIQQATACRGALDGFIAATIEHHIRNRIADPRRSEKARSAAAEELIRVVHAYMT